MILKKKKAKPDFQALWSLFMNAVINSGNSSMKAILLNHASRKEYICRKLGIVKEADIRRIMKQRKIN